VFMPTNYTAGRDAIAVLMKAARKRSEPCTGLVHLEVRFHRGTRRRSDFDNLLKPIGDAGNGILWVDDSQIVSGSWDIDWGMPPRTEVRAWVIGGW
jgi:Holliday junction resolvase RusA-like endonuclease